MASSLMSGGTSLPGRQSLGTEKTSLRGDKSATAGARKDEGANTGGAGLNAPGHLVLGQGESRSLRERFNVDMSTGGMSLSVPIKSTPGRNGFGPSLELVYDSGRAGVSGIFGVGWSLQGVDSICRKTSVAIPIYDDDKDEFVHSSAGDLVPVIEGSNDERKPVEWEEVLGNVRYCIRLYRPRVELVPLRVERWTTLDGSRAVRWKTISSGNIVTNFGQTTSSRVTGCRGQEQGLVFSWLASEVHDGFGNQMKFTYKSESLDTLALNVESYIYEANRQPVDRATQRYLKSIKYGNKKPNRDVEDWSLLDDDQSEGPFDWAFEVIFDYGEHSVGSPTTQEESPGWHLRPDPFSVHTSGFEIRTYRRCERVLMFHHFEELGCQDFLVAATELKYETHSLSGVSVLKSHTECGYQVGPTGERLSCIRLPPSQFDYWEAPDTTSMTVEDFQLELTGLDTSNAKWVDLNGDGVPGVLTRVDGNWLYHSNDSSDKPALKGPGQVCPIPLFAASGNWTLEDLQGDGQLDFVVTLPGTNTCGFHERVDGKTWSDFVLMKSLPTDYLADDFEIQKLDMTGNGYGDILKLRYDHGNEFSWHPSLGRLGYGSERRTVGAPVVPIGDVDTYVVICDMNGDGLSDVALVCRNRVVYWPNMGYGRFGACVTMGNPPSLSDCSSFSTLRVRMADVTASGTADLIYLPAEGGVHIYYNQSGNNWSNAHVLDAFPALDRFCSVSVFDVGGRGTQCLVWTSGQAGRGTGLGATMVRFIDLMGGCRPGVLTGCSNGIGGSVEISYRSSTQYRLDDERAGQGWTTRLPFPISCVQQVVTRDDVAKTACTMRYAYHNGSYDASERQFRGFQMVEQWDSEDLANLVGQKYVRPPAHTKTWFYVGCQELDATADLLGSFPGGSIPQQSPLDAAHVSSIFAAETMTSAELKDAYKALTGVQRRTEIFGHDETSKSACPYVVVQQNHEVLMRQGIHSSQRHGRFTVYSREELTCHYEREPSEAMVQHTLTTEVDDFGNVCKQAVIHYGKTHSDLDTDTDRGKQQETFIFYTETDYTNATSSPDKPRPAQTEHFQAPLSAEVREYRVFPGSSWECSASDRYSWETLVAMLPKIDEAVISDNSIAFPAGSENGVKAIASKVRTLYTKADLTDKLPLGKLEPLSIEYQTYRLAFPEKLLENALKVSDDEPLMDIGELRQEIESGGFMQLTTGDEWWAPLPRKTFRSGFCKGSDSSDLSVARSNFYIPNTEIDPLGNMTFQEMDVYRLLPERLVDAVGCESSFENDYAHMRTRMYTDANGNRTRTAFDACGRPIGVAHMGEEAETLGDSLEGFPVELSPELMESFIKDPSGPLASHLLCNAGTRTIYQDSCQIVDGKPIPSFRVELIRDTHYHDLDTATQISVQITYFDGHGEGIQEVSLSGNPEEERKWSFSGWVIRDNKGQPAKQFLPFSAPTHIFQPQTDDASFPATILLRDPLDRIVATLNADHTWTKVRFSPWTQVSFDAGDTVGIDDPSTDQDVGAYFLMLNHDSYLPSWRQDKTIDPRAVTQSERCHDTPTTAYKNALRNDIVVQTDNGQLDGGGRDLRSTRTMWDMCGDNIVEVQDALQRVVVLNQYDLIGQLVRSKSMDGGSCWFLSNARGSPSLSWSSRGYRKRIVYDGLGRIRMTKLAPLKGGPESLISDYTYGEGQADAREKNLNGQLYQRRDQSGLHTNQCFDFHGNCVESSIRYAAEYKQVIDWSKVDVEVEDTEYKVKSRFNAVGREIHVLDSSEESVWRTYDAANRLQTVKSMTKEGELLVSVDRIDYSEEGDITLIDYGNGSQTEHDYDKRTRRRIRTRTKRTEDGASLEDITYIHDCTGRIIVKDNQAQQSIYFNNTVVTPSQSFRYDAIGQLLEGTGREQVDAAKDGQKRLRPHSAFSGRGGSIPGDGRQMVEYVEIYKYDKAGNILEMQHSPRIAESYSGWTRTYIYEERSCIDASINCNRLSSTTIGKSTETFRYEGDAGLAGCVTSIPGYSMLNWDHDNRLHSFSSQRVNPDSDAIPETTWYVYNDEGKRVRKITERGVPGGSSSPPTRSKDTRFLPLRDIYVKYGGDGSSIIQTITTASVGDGELATKPIALIERISDSQQPLIRYRAGEALELDNSSNIVTYEEYSPYGSVTYQSRADGATPRKYRFMQYQRDRESGLDICGERYYASWLGRWTSADPLGIADGLNAYAYVANDPVNYDDQGGTVREQKVVGGPKAARDETGYSKRMRGWIRRMGAREGAGGGSQESPFVSLLERPGEGSSAQLTRREMAEAKLSRTVVYDQVRLPLGMIRFSQEKISPQVHNPEELDKLSNVRQEMGSLKAEVRRLKKREGLSQGAAESQAADSFLRKFGQINVALVVGSQPGAENDAERNANKNGWYSMDNRRLAILKGALSKTVPITARFATQEEFFGMVGLGATNKADPSRQKFSEIYDQGYAGGWKELEAKQLKDYFKSMKGKGVKWSTKNDGSSIRISSGSAGQRR
ncbi:virulence plasmid 65kDa B protein-domain-containing protein [Daldinia sp. FL1419]|nr:virulence plasmid 65kDa B protein-domain-containing protein [Daldinia sp. FL1419]